MPSLIPGYEYDIFISYRQKDNKGDGWVSEFVEALKTELESTFKEDISVYFDINPHDGLLETHDVDESLKEKFKCLVFIPIISRTYCDPKAFAWEHEFKAFVEHASKDQFGLKVKLPNSNVASRVLPVQIHDLDNEDITLCESVLGGVLRGIEFIYKEPGVNKPLTYDDDDRKNLNNTKYRIQINKVANSIKEIITGIRQSEKKPVEESEKTAQATPTPGKWDRNKLIAVSAIVLILVILGILFVPKLFRQEEAIEKSIAVLPFKNDSPDPENEYFCNGMMETILNQLVKIGDLKVMSRTEVEPYRNTTKTRKEIAAELGVANILEGSVYKMGNRFRISVQLINSTSGFHLWSEEYEGEYTEEIFTLQSNIARQVASALKAVITPEEEMSIEAKPTENIEAYDLVLKGYEMTNNYWKTLDSKYNQLAHNLLNKALEIDPGYIEALELQCNIFLGENKLDSTVYFADRIIKLDPERASGYLYRGIGYGWMRQSDLSIESFLKATEIQPDDINIIQGLARSYCWKQDLENGLPWLQKAINMNDDLDPGIILNAGELLMYLGHYKKADEYVRKAIDLNVGCQGIQRHCECLVGQGEISKANQFLDSVCDISDCDKLCNLYKFYANMCNKDYRAAEVYYNKFLEFSDFGERNWTHFIGDSVLLAYMYMELDKKDIALNILNNYRKSLEKQLAESESYYTYINLSSLYTILEDKEKSISYLSEAMNQEYNVGMYTFTVVNPFFDFLRDEPEFKAFVQQGLDKQAANIEKFNEMKKRGEIDL
jgi:TolB-like protein